MKIYTSYYGKLRKLSEHDIVPIAISIYPPKYYQGNMMKELAPTKQILHMENPQYSDRFQKEILDKLNPHEIVKKAIGLGFGKDVALLCFEVPTDFCHRQLVAKWLNDAGYEVEEFYEPEKKVEPKKPVVEQASLF
jgi:uncharacterized protein (DUF488 family)